MVQQTPPPSAPGPEPNESRRVEPWFYWLLGGIGVVLIILIALAVGGDGDDTPFGIGEDEPTGSEVTGVTLQPEAASSESIATEATATTLGPGETPGEVFLETAGSLGPDPFTGEVFAEPVVTTTAPIVTMPPTTSTSSSTTTTSPTGQTAPPPPVVVSTMNGDTPGLYGGTGDQARCDKEAILAFLEANPDKAAAWVAAMNADPAFRWNDGRTQLAVADLRAYFDELTPVTLLYDTRVTNHGYRNGRPTPRQSVLQAGTAVLVDRWGVPRARCACGNPLTPPQPSPVPPTWVGPPWTGFDPTIIIVVNQSVTVIQEITIINIFTGDIIIRPVGTSGDQDVPQPTDTSGTTGLTIPPDITVGTGDVQVTLIWANDSDMDLHVIDPEGFEIYYSTDFSPSGGELDVDDVPDEGDGGPHVENVYWPSGGAPGGRYVTFVYHYGSYTGAPAGYTLEVRVGGGLIHTETGVLAEDEESPRFEFLLDTQADLTGSPDQAVADFLAANGLPVDSAGACGPDGEPGTYCYEYVETLPSGQEVYSAVLQFGDAPVIWMLLGNDGGPRTVVDSAQGDTRHPW